MSKFIIIGLFVFITTGCTLNKAVYFEADSGTISGQGVMVTGDKIKYHSVPCSQTEGCKPENH